MTKITLLGLLALSGSLVAAPTYELADVIPTGLRDPMELSVAPNGDLYVVEREGRVLRVRPQTGGVFEIGKIEVAARREGGGSSPIAAEEGLLGIALDPKLPQNRRLFLYYSDPVKKLIRLSRFTLKDGMLDRASELMLLEVPVERDKTNCHNAGSLAFGPDGLLYLSLGDNTNPFESAGHAPIDDRPGRTDWDAQRSAGNTNDLRGKVLRIRPTEKGYDIPRGNLFPPGTPKTRPEIYAMGCRNPFRISIDPKKSIVYWGEVGPDANA
ncbi:MAG TPA: PQQ-dependent sugar dehydrogenase, partial [Luteolibacter sp.]